MVGVTGMSEFDVMDDMHLISMSVSIFQMNRVKSLSLMQKSLSLMHNCKTARERGVTTLFFMYISIYSRIK